MESTVAKYDYVTVGADAAGGAIASRLSAQPGISVLLLEAGGRDWSPLVHMAAGFVRLGGPRYNWGFSTVLQRELDGREMWCPQGRTLGGSTSINAVIYIRGQREGYDSWAAIGNKNWGYEQVLPFFRRAEANERLNDRHHGNAGAVSVSEQVQHYPLSKAFIRAPQELGLPFTADFNGARQEGVGWYDVTQKNAERDSTATAYKRPARGWANLAVRTHVTGRKIIVENGRAAGLGYLASGHVTRVRVGRELIVSSGAVNAPRLLLLSGIGPVGELSALGVPVTHELLGVGKNLPDHMDVYRTAATAPVSYNQSGRVDKAALEGLQYVLTRTGPVTAGVCEAGMFVRSGSDVVTPDTQLHALPAYAIDHGRTRVKGHGITINTCQLRPRSVGAVTLRSASPDEPPAIDPAFLTDPYDWDKSLEGFRCGREILRGAAFKPFITKEYLRQADLRSDRDIRSYIRTWAKTDYHPVGTCKMGDDQLAVVDAELKVRGQDGLRVVDASVMPRLISGNTMAAATMIGEKGAHHILDGLTPPDPVDGPI